MPGLLEVASLLSNRSVPTNSLPAHIRYRNVEEAIAWLTRSFAFVVHYRYGDPVRGAQMNIGEAWIMLEAARDHAEAPGWRTQPC